MPSSHHWKIQPAVFHENFQWGIPAPHLRKAQFLQFPRVERWTAGPFVAGQLSKIWGESGPGNHLSRLCQ
jgi:hypothetical protein